MGEKFAELAASVLARARPPVAMADITTVPDTAGQTATLAALNAQGILTDADFVDKNTELVGRL